jgi:hypothetical protein
VGARKTLPSAARVLQQGIPNQFHKHRKRQCGLKAAAPITRKDPVQEDRLQDKGPQR